MEAQSMLHVIGCIDSQEGDHKTCSVINLDYLAIKVKFRMWGI